MNIVSSIVGLAIMGVATPPMLKMSIAPAEAQVRAQNLSEAESHAVVFASTYENKPTIPVATTECPTLIGTGGGSYTVTCEGGSGRYLKTISRSFRLLVQNNNTYTNPNRQFAYATPPAYSHVECLSTDPWGVMWYNEHLAAGNLKACIPAPVWSKERYLESNPDDWLYDLSDHGYGSHPLF